MKPDEDNCWYNGRHEFCRETYPGQYEWCSADYHRCVECTDDAHCPPERPWCDWDMECEECLVSSHCATGESCLMRNGKWVCRRKDCVDYSEEGDFDYCVNNFGDTPICDTVQRRCVECIIPSDCEGERETCIHSECVDESDMDCVQQIEAGFPNYCELTFPERPICHTRLRDCVECQFDFHCGEDERCAGTRCIPEEWECVGPEDCISDDYKCINHECIRKDCSDYDNPDAYCSEKRDGWRCLNKVCVRCIEDEDCLHLDSLCPQNEWCNGDHCEEGCRDSENCGEYTPHCSQNTGKCEECFYDSHCDDGYDCDNYKCVWVGYDCTFDPECPENWFCSNRSCVFGCNLSDDNCANATPHCSQETGKCEECWCDPHCEGWQECKEYRCVARPEEAECEEGDVKPGKRCRDGIWVDIECKGPEDCKGHEYCDDGLCRDKERGCEKPEDCPSGYWCDTSNTLPEFHRCVKQECRSHDECPTGQGCNYAELGGGVRDNARTECLSWREWRCGASDPCPEEGWVCDGGSGFCVEALCGPGKPCQDDRYKCVDNICVPKRCEDREDPQGYCMEEKGWYGRCLDGACVVLSCNSYPDPDLMCQETEGESWRCVDKRCIDLGTEGTDDLNANCRVLLGVDEAFWDFKSRSCEVPDCNTVEDPDKLCAQLKDPSYKCRGDECRHGREGEECAGTPECVVGLRCADGLCIEKECIRWQDCNDPEMWCNHGVCEPMRTECSGPEDCRDDYHCDAGGQCVPNACDDHYDCGEGECCSGSKECIRCELMTCWYNFHCRRGWRCNLGTNRCQRVGCTVSSECEEGYYCDLDDGICKKIEEGGNCKHSSECPPGMVCKGFAVYAQSDFLTILGPITMRYGTCVLPEEAVMAVRGIDDSETCDYCRSMWTKTGREGSFELPPYHSHCRCWGIYVD